MRTNVTSVAAPVCLLALLLAPAAGAQQHRASLRGAIVDPSMAPLTDVEVRVMSEATGDVRTVKSDGGGRFVMPELLPGPYRVEVRHGGYGPFLARVTLELNESLPLEIALQLGNLIQAVDVTAPTAAIDRDSAALGTFIDARQLAGLPLDGRQPRRRAPPAHSGATSHSRRTAAARTSMPSCSTACTTSIRS